MANPNWLFFIGSTTTGVQPRPEVIDADKWQGTEYLPFGNRAARMGALVVVAAATAFAFVGPSVTIAPETVTVDKWQQEANRPSVTAKRGGYLSSWLCAPERQQLPDLDSWVPAALQPQFDRKRSQCAYPYFVAPDQQQVPDLDSWWQQSSDYLRQRLTLSIADAPSFTRVPTEQVFAEKWHSLTNLPRSDVARRQFSYAVGALPDQQQLPDADSWLPAANQPRFDLRRTQYGTPSHFTADQQQIPDLDSWWQQLGEAVRLPDRRVQGQLGLTALGVPPAEDVEEVSPDRWQPLSNQPQFDRLRTQCLQARTEWTSTFSANRVFPDSWHPLIGQPQFDLKRSQFASPVFAFSQISFAERTSPDKYVPLENLPKWDIARRQWNYPTNGGPEIQSQPRLDSWLPLANQFQFDAKRLQALFPALAFTEAVFQETIRPDKWQPLANQPVFCPGRTQFLSAKSEWVSTFTDNRVFPDSWHPESNRSQFDQKRIQVLYPAFAGADRQPQPRVDSWWQQAQEFLRQPDRRVLRLGASELDLTPTQDIERTSVDKYYPGVQQPQFDKKRTQFGFAFTSFDPQPFASPIFADSWHPLTKQPLFDRDRRVQRLGDSELTLAVNQRSERATPDKWQPVIEQPRASQRAIKAENYGLPFTPRTIFVDSWWQQTNERPQSLPSRQYHAFTYAERQPESRLDSWWQQTNERLRNLPSRLHLADFFTSGTTPFELTSVDKYDAGTQRPRFDQARRQYLAQCLSLVERQSEPRLDSWWQAPAAAVLLADGRAHVLGTSEVLFSQRAILADSWWQQTNERVRVLPAVLYLSFSSADGQPEPSFDGWYQTNAAPVWTITRLFRALAENELALTPSQQAERVSIDRFDPGIQQPQFDLERLQYIAPSFFSPDRKADAHAVGDAKSTAQNTATVTVDLRSSAVNVEMARTAEVSVTLASGEVTSSAKAIDVVVTLDPKLG